MSCIDVNGFDEDDGQDLKAVYGDILGFLPSEFDHQAIKYRATTNVSSLGVTQLDRELNEPWCRRISPRKSLVL